MAPFLMITYFSNKDDILMTFLTVKTTQRSTKNGPHYETVPHSEEVKLFHAICFVIHNI